MTVCAPKQLSTRSWCTQRSVARAPPPHHTSATAAADGAAASAGGAPLAVLQPSLPPLAAGGGGAARSALCCLRVGTVGPGSSGAQGSCIGIVGSSVDGWAGRVIT